MTETTTTDDETDDLTITASTIARRANILRTRYETERALPHPRCSIPASDVMSQ